jgi:hypothetical protein
MYLPFWKTFPQLANEEAEPNEKVQETNDWSALKRRDTAADGAAGEPARGAAHRDAEAREAADSGSSGASRGHSVP